MALTASNRFVNVTGMTFTPLGGSAVPIKGVKSVSYNPQVNVISDGGDGDFFNTSAGAYGSDPMFTVTFLNAAALAAVTPGVAGTLTFTLNDSRNGALTGGGGIIFTVVNAIFSPQTWDMTFRAYSTNSLQLTTFSADGVTSPVSQAAA